MAQSSRDLEAGFEEKELGSPKSPSTSTTLQDGSVLSRGSLSFPESTPSSIPSDSWPSKVKQLYQTEPATNTQTTLPRQRAFPPTVRRLEECPEGYPRLAAFLDSDENFMVYRRFGYVFARLILHKQSQLQRLEAALDSLDQYDANQDPTTLTGDEDPDSLTNSDWAQDEDSGRYQLFADLERTAKEYAELVALAKELTATSRPSNCEYRSVCSYVGFTRENGLSEHDEPNLQLKNDLITLRPGREHAWLDESIEQCLRFIHTRLRCHFVHKLFCSEDMQQQHDPSDTVVYYSRTRINLVASAIITIAILALLIAPIYILYHLTSSDDKGSHTAAVCIGTLIVFILAFSAVLSFFTRARRHEILGAAAAYAAVLVVFLSSVPGVSSPLTKS